MQIDFPVFSVEIPVEEFTVPSGSTFLYSRDADEDRALPSQEWFSQIDPVGKHQAALGVNVSEELEISFPPESPPTRVSLFDAEGIRDELEGLPQPLYLDITGLSHRTWAPLIRAAQSSKGIDLRVIYLEPAEYLRRVSVDEQPIYDLSEKFEGLRPLPGFAILEPRGVDKGYFVPMIGFEGSRLEYVLTQSDANLAKTFPVVGVPGFRPDYAFFAYQSNRHSLEKDFLHRRIHFAKANCPFDAFSLLSKIHEWSGKTFLRIAPIGTKPHALAAVLFALSHPDEVELVYDNPIRARKRTAGQGRVLVYAVSAFMASAQFA
ncbi:hypothetical protein [Microbacterium maritypicum]